MKYVSVLLIMLAMNVEAQSTKDILLTQLKNSHNQANWYAPVNAALTGVTADQAKWKSHDSDHSIAELASHLAFWNERNLKAFRNETQPKFDGDNTETFSNVDEKSWPELVKRVDQILTDLEKEIATAPEEKLKKWYATIAAISAHNAYHTGQIVFIRKLQGSWNPDNGVK